MACYNKYMSMGIEDGFDELDIYTSDEEEMDVYEDLSEKISSAKNKSTTVKNKKTIKNLNPDIDIYEDQGWDKCLADIREILLNKMRYKPEIVNLSRWDYDHGMPLYRKSEPPTITLLTLFYPNKVYRYLAIQELEEDEYINIVPLKYESHMAVVYGTSKKQPKVIWEINEDEYEEMKKAELSEMLANGDAFQEWARYYMHYLR